MQGIQTSIQQVRTDISNDADQQSDLMIQCFSTLCSGLNATGALHQTFIPPARPKLREATALPAITAYQYAKQPAASTLQQLPPAPVTPPPPLPPGSDALTYASSQSTTAGSGSVPRLVLPTPSTQAANAAEVLSISSPVVPRSMFEADPDDDEKMGDAEADPAHLGELDAPATKVQRTEQTVDRASAGLPGADAKPTSK